MNLTEYLKCYSYFPKFTEFLYGEVVQAIRDSGYLESEDLVIIYVWKSILFQIHKGFESYGVESDERKIRSVTKRIFEINHLSRDDVAKLLNELVLLRGVGVKVASAILSVIFPELHGVFDKHVKKALGIKGEDEESCVEAIWKMRKIAKEQEHITGKYWTPRDVNKALWILNKR